MDTLAHLGSGLIAALGWQNLAFAIIGCVLGTLIGVLPGVGPAAGTAILIPLTFKLDATAAIIMLCAIYYGAMYGGTITSVLINVPGEAASVVTCLDGYQMARNGRGGTALGVAAIGSFVGGLVATIALVAVAPPLAKFALSFGPPEFFALMLVGLCLVTALAGKSVVAGLLILAWLMLAAGACAWLVEGRCSHAYSAREMRPARGSSRARSLLRVALALACVWTIAGFYSPAMTWVRYRTQRNPQLFAVGDFMKAYAKPGSLLAISGGGIIPYRSDLPAIEMWGLTDLHIARVPSRRLARGVPGHTKGDGAYILARKPRYIVFIALLSTKRAPLPQEIAARIAGPSELDLWQSELFHKRYALRTFPLPDGHVTNFFELRN